MKVIVPPWKILRFMQDVRDEYSQATEKHGMFSSAHEGYAVLFEEVDELKEWVWKKRSNRDEKAMYDECVQIAAMALKFAVGLCMPTKEK